MERKFLIEREIEAMLVQEARFVPLPDGSQTLVRQFRLVWDNLEVYLRYLPLTRARVSAIALSHSRLRGLPVDEAFYDVVVVLGKRARDVMRRRLDALKRNDRW